MKPEFIQRTAILRVLPYNSTVNGRRAVKENDAHEWANGWKGLVFKNAYKDGHPQTNMPFGMFGAGRKGGFSCGEYLHVPLSKDERRYRVRCRFQPGYKYKGKKILYVRLNKNDDKWYWLLDLAK